MVFLGLNQPGITFGCNNFLISIKTYYYNFERSIATVSQARFSTAFPFQFNIWTFYQGFLEAGSEILKNFSAAFVLRMFKIIPNHPEMPRCNY